MSSVESTVESKEEFFIAPELPQPNKKSNLPKSHAHSEILVSKKVTVTSTQRKKRRASVGHVAYPKFQPEFTPKTSNRKVSRFFSDLEQEINVPEDTRRSLGRQLHQLVIQNELDVMEVLLQQGADPNGGGSERPPLYTAADLQNIEACRVLLKHGASMVSQLTVKGKETTPLQVALADKELAPLFRDQLRKLEKQLAQPVFNHYESPDEPLRKKQATTTPQDF